MKARLTGPSLIFLADRRAAQGKHLYTAPTANSGFHQVGEQWPLKNDLSAALVGHRRRPINPKRGCGITALSEKRSVQLSIPGGRRKRRHPDHAAAGRRRRPGPARYETFFPGVEADVMIAWKNRSALNEGGYLVDQEALAGDAAHDLWRDQRYREQYWSQIEGV